MQGINKLFAVQLSVARKAPVLISVELLVAALIFHGCVREPSTASMSRLAVARSNQEAKRLYHIEPFNLEHGLWQTEGQQQLWEALTSSGGYDMTAKVIFDEKGSVVRVEVRMLVHPNSEPPTNLLPRPDITRERRLGIPEVMPK